MKYQTAIFDFDGTVMYTFDGARAALEYAYRKLGFTPPPQTVLRTFMGPSLFDSFMRVSGFDEATALKAVGYYREVYNTEFYKYTAFYDGMRKLLTRLKRAGLTVAVATSKPQNAVEKILTELHATDIFSSISAPDNASTTSDKASLVRRAVSGKSVMIGDRKFDIDAANAVGIDSIAVLYGFGSAEELEACKPTYIAETVADVGKILLDR